MGTLLIRAIYITAFMTFFVFFSRGEGICKINGKIKGLNEGEKVYLTLRMGINGLIDGMNFDSSLVRDHSFQLNGTIPDGPRLFYIYFENHKNQFLVLFIDNETISIESGESDINNMPTGNIFNYVDVKFSQVQADFKKTFPVAGVCASYYTNIENYLVRLNEQENSDLIKGILASNKVFNFSVYNYLLQTLQREPHNQAIPYFVINAYHWIGKDSLIGQVYNKLDERAKDSYYGKILRDIITTCIGKVAPDFAMTTTSGEEVRFSNLVRKSKLTLLYFLPSINSSSFTDVINRLTNELVEMYEKYSSKGLNIIGIVPKDKERKSLPWNQIGQTEDLRNLYGFVPSIVPFIYLIDDKGKIIAWKLEGAVLNYMIKSHLGEN